jgi:protein transport protein SEC24
LPPLVRANKQSLDDAGAYLIGITILQSQLTPENGQTMILYIGRNAVPLLLNDLFGPTCNYLSDLDHLLSTMPEVDSTLSVQLRNILAYISDTRPARSLHVQIARQTIDGAEQEVASLLIEDRHNEAQAYQDFLLYLHRQINLEVFILLRLTNCRRVETGITMRIACGLLDFSVR